MIVRFMALWMLLVTASLVTAQERPVLKTDEEKASYAIGLDIGTNFKRQSIDIDQGALKAGITDALSGRDPLLTDEEARNAMNAFRKKMMAQAEARDSQVREANLKEGEAYLAENKKKKGVTTLPSGLQYKVITEGTGKIPKTTDTVKTHYRGTLIDGTEFDSSFKRGEPATFPVTGVIKGWTEALQLMKVGSKWELFISPDLAYGPRGAGQMIGPNATLIFEIELLGIE